VETHEMERLKLRSGLLFWFCDTRASGDQLYHAYRSRKFGAQPVCGQGPLIRDLNSMDSGGSRSKCCLECVKKAYNLDLPGGKNESR